MGSDRGWRARSQRDSHFNPRSPCGERRATHRVRPLPTDFNPRSPCGERPLIPVPLVGDHVISIHAPRVGSDGPSRRAGRPTSNFNPRSPCGERLASRRVLIRVQGDFNPRSPCGERLKDKLLSTGAVDFNPRSPCGERRDVPRHGSWRQGFQSTLPVWGATRHHVHDPQIPVHFNPRSPCGERPIPSTQSPAIARFQSTLPVWGATILHIWAKRGQQNFNPRSPCGERPFSIAHAIGALAFQSTLPVWGATVNGALWCTSRCISIHAPRVGSDYPLRSSDIRARYFNPRSPCGERHM